ncbi:uncharacterized protein DEA37_0005951 [Paragonimus westermani]|uniref:Enkurin domain-containing protein n=1 Tax=Paragonimus westermani TaxID=34504 RepID=A0A5J4NGS5_9TREM|nr:uncharacterized protein DEA37_0005951 [Paragonimus westermani]
MEPARPTCGPDVRFGNPPTGPREYIYNLVLLNKPKVISKHTCLPKIRVIPKKQNDLKRESMKTMGPSHLDRLSSVTYPDKRTYVLKQSKKPYVKLVNHTAQDCLEATVKQATELEGHVQLGRSNCLTGSKAPLSDLKGTRQASEVKDFPPKCVKRVRNDVNWITRNAITAITSEPGYRLPLINRRQVVDTRKGDKFSLKSQRTSSGLEPLYVYKHGLGKVPGYILKWKRMVKKTQELLTEFIHEKELQRMDFLLTEKQREELLNGLKAAWDRYNKKYLGLASINDTLKGKAYKAYLEHHLDMLKADIELVEGHRFLFVESLKNPEAAAKSVLENICT